MQARLARALGRAEFVLRLFVAARVELAGDAGRAELAVALGEHGPLAGVDDGGRRHGGEPLRALRRRLHPRLRREHAVAAAVAVHERRLAPPAARRLQTAGRAVEIVMRRQRLALRLAPLAPVRVAGQRQDVVAFLEPAHLQRRARGRFPNDQILAGRLGKPCGCQ